MNREEIISAIEGMTILELADLVKEMEEKGLLHKIASENDGRVTYITVTEAGKKLSKKYDEEYFTGLSSALSDISEEEADCMIQTIEKFYERMRERRTHYDK